MLRQINEGLSELRRSRNSFVPQCIAKWIVPEWSLVLISALIQSWEIFSDYFVGKSTTEYRVVHQVVHYLLLMVKKSSVTV